MPARSAGSSSLSGGGAPMRRIVPSKTADRGTKLTWPTHPRTRSARRDGVARRRRSPPPGVRPGLGAPPCIHSPCSRAWCSGSRAAVRMRATNARARTALVTRGALASLKMPRRTQRVRDAMVSQRRDPMRDAPAPIAETSTATHEARRTTSCRSTSCAARSSALDCPAAQRIGKTSCAKSIDNACEAASPSSSRAAASSGCPPPARS